MTPTVKLHPQPSNPDAAVDNPLPQLIQTPSGLAILELQGTINLPQTDPEAAEGEDTQEVSIGKISFPDYHPDIQDPASTSWMKRVHLYVGHHQRLTGEVKKLPRAVAVVRRREKRVRQGSGGPVEEQGDNLEVVEIVKYKLVFSSRPEPVGTEAALT